MPTKTKPKRIPDLHMIPVTLKDADKGELCELCGFDRVTDSGGYKSAAMLDGLRGLLTIEFNRLRRVPVRPLPAHVIAALDPIAQKSRELAALMYPGSLPVKVLTELNVSDVTNGNAWLLLTHIANAAEVTISRLQERNSTGQHKQAQREAMELAELTIGDLFDAHAIEPDGWEKANFLAICKKYLTLPC